MGLDIYAGTLTRYYAHNWKSAVQQWAEENGYTFQKITPDGAAVDDEEEEMRPAEVQDIVENWRDQILAAIAAPGHEPLTFSSQKLYPCFLLIAICIFALLMEKRADILFQSCLLTNAPSVPLCISVVFPSVSILKHSSDGAHRI